jgi:PD-(D/E)XK nuclease superfamily
MTTSQKQISAKTLGSLALPGFCPRCFWIQRHAKKLPYQIFPGIFSSIDSYSKRLVHGWFDIEGRPPRWLERIGKVKSYRNPPSAANFYIVDKETSIKLTGAPDGILIKEDGSLVIIDYKTARFTAHQDELLPMYEAQLNAYAHIGKQVWKEPVSALALVYTEPVTDDASARDAANRSDNGFRLPFIANIVPVDMKSSLVPDLLSRAKHILDSPAVPAGRDGCQDCESLARLLELSSH